MLLFTWHNLSSSVLSKKLNVNTYKTIRLPVESSGSETWSLTLREHLRLLVFENKVLRKIFGAKRDKILENGESYTKLSYMHCNIIMNLTSRQLKWAGHVARMEQSRNEWWVLVWKLEGKLSSGRPRRRWKTLLKRIWGTWVVMMETE